MRALLRMWVMCLAGLVLPAQIVKFTRTDYGAGSQPAAGVTGDFNRDGTPDLAVVNPGSDTVTVLLGGLFGSPASCATGAQPSAVAAGDFNGDGKLDLVVANRVANSVSILLGAGNGTFGGKTDFVAGLGPSGVVAADISRDGKLDVMVANSGANSVSVLLGTGSGALSAKSDFATGVEPIALTAIDLNRDGIVDLVTSNSGANTISILIGNGNGTFGAKTDYAAGSGTAGIVAGDFNSDGKTDLAVAAALSGSVLVFTGNGNGTLNPAVTFAAGSGARAVIAGDFNRDGRLDLATANAFAGTTAVLTGRGNGSFDAATTWDVGGMPGWLAACDLNRDGKADIVLANSAVNVVQVMLNTTALARSGENFVTSTFEAGQGPESIATGDFNSDGRPDLVIGNIDNNTVTLLAGGGNGTFAAGGSFAVASSPAWMITGDFNRDGRLDVVSANYGGQVSVLLGNGGGGFAPRTDIATGRRAVSVASADFNRDGKADLAVVDEWDDKVSILFGTGDGGFGGKLDIGGYSIPKSVVAEDFNRDGKMDIAVADQTVNASASISVLLGNGDGTFAPGISVAAGSESTCLTAGDFNRDGVADLATVNVGIGAPRITVMLGAGNGTFTAPAGVAVSLALRMLTSEDVNGDGKEDLVVVGSGNSFISLLQGNGDGTFGTSVTSGTGAWPMSVIVSDLNLDGKMDMATANDFGSTHNVTVQINVTPDLAVTKSHNGSFVVGSQATYVMTVANVGDVDIGGPVFVRDELPSGLTYVSASSAKFDCEVINVRTVNCRGTQFPKQETTTILLTVAVEQSAYPSITNSASVSYYWDTNPANDSSSDPATVYLAPDLTIEKAHAGQFVVGGNGVYMLRVRNRAGAAPTSGTITVTDTLPAGLGFWWASGTGWNCTSVGQVATCTNPGPLAGGASSDIALTATVGAGAYPGVTNTASVANASDVNAANNSAVDLTLVTFTPGLRFVAVQPCRVVDTRSSVGPFGGPFLGGNTSRSFAIPSGSCGIPSSAQAYSLNVTVVPRTGQLQWLTMWPTGQTQPWVSTLNSFGGDVVANAAIVPAGTNGAVSVFVTNDTEVILDINGYFDILGSSSFYADTPCRVVDTRWPAGPLGGPEMGVGQTRSFAIPSSTCGIPGTATAYSMNYTVVPSGYLGYLSTWPAGQSMPVVSTLNSWRGKVVANAAIVPAGTGGAVSVYVTDPTQVILDINGHFGPPGGNGALSFYPVTPCRVADTRNAAGAFGGPILGMGATRSFAVPQSACGIPATAKAYSVNVTVVPSGPLSYLTAWPTGSPQPVVSTLNSWDGAVVANAAIVPAGTNGAISFFVTDSTHLIVDINGYFQ